MSDRRTKPRGLLRDVRRHPFARLGAVLALFAYLVIGLSPLWGPAVELGGIEVCTANGIRVIPADWPLPSEPAGKPEPKRDCPLCTIQAAFPLPPAEVALEAFGRDEPAFAQTEPSDGIAGLFAGFDHLSRAPPLLS